MKKVSDMARRVVDVLALDAIREAKKRVASDMPAMVTESVRRVIKKESDKAVTHAE